MDYWLLIWISTSHTTTTKVRNSSFLERYQSIMLNRSYIFTECIQPLLDDTYILSLIQHYRYLLQKPHTTFIIKPIHIYVLTVEQVILCSEIPNLNVSSFLLVVIMGRTCSQPLSFNKFQCEHCFDTSTIRGDYPFSVDISFNILVNKALAFPLLKLEWR